MFTISHYHLHELAAAILVMVPRIRERFSDRPALVERADTLFSTANAVHAAYGGVDTRAATAAVALRDQRRDDEVRALDRLLSAHALSSVFAATAEAAGRLHRELFGDGLDFLKSNYHVESVRVRELIAILEREADVVARLGLTPHVGALREAQAAFDAELDARGELRAARPDLVADARRPLHRALRATLLLLEELGQTPDVAYVLEPLKSLTRRPAGDAPAPAPTPAT